MTSEAGLAPMRSAKSLSEAPRGSRTKSTVAARNLHPTDGGRLHVVELLTPLLLGLAAASRGNRHDDRKRRRAAVTAWPPPPGRLPPPPPPRTTAGILRAPPPPGAPTPGPPHRYGTGPACAALNPGRPATRSSGRRRRARRRGRRGRRGGRDPARPGRHHAGPRGAGHAAWAPGRDAVGAGARGRGMPVAPPVE